MMGRAKCRVGFGAIALLVGALVWPSAAWAAGGQWTLAEVSGTTCFNLLVDTPVDGPMITGARQLLQEEFSDRDLIYTVAADGLSIGERLQVVRNTGAIDHPATGDHAGLVLEILGVVEVVDVNEEHALYRVLGACREFEVGDVLRSMPAADELLGDLPRMPVFDHARLVTPSDDDAFLVMGALESVIRSSEEPERIAITQYQIYGERDLMVIDQGADSAWELGDIAMLYRDRVYADSNLLRKALVVPPVLGRAMVVHADSSSAVLQIIDSVDEIQVGDRARDIGHFWDFVNRAPVVTCSAERTAVRAGESVRLTADVTDADGDSTTVSWDASAGTLSSAQGGTVTWTASNLESDSGMVEVVATADDGQDDGTTDCLIELSIGPLPPGAATVVPEGAEVLDFVCPEIPLGVTETDNRCKAVLDDVALRMRQDPRATADLVGHSDSSGADEVNEELSQQRADAARTYLVETHGIDAARIRTSGLGAAQPIADNETPEGRLQNRRIEIRVILPGGDS